MKFLYSIIAALVVTAPVHALNLRFDTSNLTGIADSDVYIHFQGIASNSISYGANSVDFGTSNYLTTGISLQTLNSNGGFFNTDSLNGSIYISYKTPLGGGAAPTYIGGGATLTQYERVELTHNPGNFNSGGNPTNINWFSFPVSITSYTQANPTSLDTPVQNKQFTNPNAAHIANRIEGITGFNSNFTVLDAANNVVRYIGPSSFPPPPGLPSMPYASWVPYLESINTANTTTTMKNSSGFNIKDGQWQAGASQGSINYNFVFDLSMSVIGQVVNNAFQFESIQLTGTITGTQTPFGGGTTTISGGSSPINNPGVWDVSLNIWGLDPALPQYDTENLAAFNTALYGGVVPVGFNNSELLTKGGDYNLWLSEMNAIAGLNSGPNAAGSVLQAQIIGENSSGFAFGYINSTITPADLFPNYNGPDKDVMFKDMDSSKWWGFNTLPNQLQPNNPFYNEWSAIILEESLNQVYGQVYADRYAEPFNPFLFSMTTDGTATGDEIGSWVITLHDPVPEPSTILLLALAVIIYLVHRKRCANSMANNSGSASK